ncbi:hypothetical protein T10_13663, partial [Trichinella papuae]
MGNFPMYSDRQSANFTGHSSDNYWTVSGETLKNTIIYQYK